jgi:hypothetical protein
MLFLKLIPTHSTDTYIFSEQDYLVSKLEINKVVYMGHIKGDPKVRPDV